MALIFRDKEGKILGREWTDTIDFESHIKNHGFPVDCTIEKVTKEELLKTIPKKSEPKMHLEPYQRKALEIENRIDRLVESLEEILKLNKGDLKAMVTAK